MRRTIAHGVDERWPLEALVVGEEDRAQQRRLEVVEFVVLN
jgi:hypothetical protein